MRKFTESFAILILLLCSCGEHKPSYPFADITMASFASMQKSKYEISERKVRFYIDSLRLAQKDSDYVDLLSNTYYAERKPFLWINKGGADLRADIALSWLDSAKASGIPAKRLFIDSIEKALKRTRSGRFEKKYNINYTLAELEYYLTKGYMRFAKGQRFGFIDAKKVFNQLDIDDSNAGHKYKVLYSAQYDNFSKEFFERATSNINPFRVDTFLNNIQPKSDIYNQLTRTLKENRNLNTNQRNALVCNIERTRWRTPEVSRKDGFIEVNIPSQQLSAINAKGEELNMKICFGNYKTKTPILDSKITHIDINPYWVVPTSIVRKEIARHALDAEYFERKSFEIIERSSGEKMSPEEVTEDMFMHGGYTVRQQRGQQNSLGRIIFRFPNEHAIYLHDTNEKQAFNREKRSMSHGCIRLEKPLELALLYLNKKDEKLIQNLQYSITENPNETGSTKKDGHFINTVDINPDVPISIMYYTCYPGKDGKVNYYDDIYKYDPILLKRIKHC